MTTTLPIFCAQCASEQPHDLTVDQNHEVVATCPAGHFIKFPEPQSADDLKRLIEAHNKENADRAVQAAATNERRAKVTSILDSLA